MGSESSNETGRRIKEYPSSPARRDRWNDVDLEEGKSMEGQDGGAGGRDAASEFWAVERSSDRFGEWGT